MEVNEILAIARNMVEERTDSLQNDVKRCVFGADVYTHTQAAPFPALLYCFSTIDLLGALYGGNAEGNSTKQSGNYMTEVMFYPEEKAFLLQQVFRHKIVHLAQPAPRSSINESLIDKKIKGESARQLRARLKDKISTGLYQWGIEHCDRVKHLVIEPLGKEGQDERFCLWVSIWSLVEDIVDSVYKPDGYMHRLENDDTLRKKFVKAYNQIFETNL